MKAVVWHGARDIHFEDRPLPSPGPGQALMRVQCMGICGSDLKLYQYGVLGTHRPSAPFVMGHECAGDVTAVGPGVTDLSPGMRIAIDPLAACGECFYCRRGEENLCEHMAFKSVTTDGVFTEYILIRPDQAACLPPGFDYRLAATIEPLSIAVQALRAATVNPSDAILLIGCGTIGLSILSLLLRQGARHVLAVDIREYACERALQIGAEQAVNSSREDLAQKSAAFFGRRGPDVVIEAAGSSAAQAAAFEIVRPGGTILLVGITPDATAPINVNRLVRSNLHVFGTVRTSGDAFATAAELVISGQVNTRVLISRVFPFDSAPQAFEAAADPSSLITKCLVEF